MQAPQPGTTAFADQPRRGLGIRDEERVLAAREQPSEISIEGDQVLAEMCHG